VPAFVDHLTSVADVLLSDVTNGEVRVNVGEETTGAGFGSSCTLWAPDGFISCPSPADATGACQIFWVQEGDQKICVAARDNRLKDKVGSLQPGDKAIVSTVDARFLLKASDNGISLMTFNGGDQSQPMLVNISGSKGSATIYIGGPGGTSSVLQMTPTSIKLGVANGGSLTIDAQGVHVTGTSFNANCGGGTLGLISAVPPIPPQPPVNGILYGPPPGVPSLTWGVAP
jgi:hypothetical protein